MSAAGSSYTFDSGALYTFKRSSTNDGISLSYSQTSADSSDGSMNGILRALGTNGDSADLPALLKQSSSAHSLSGYSTDGESYLAGTDLLQTIARPQSEEIGDDRPSVIELLGTPQKVQPISNIPTTTVEGSPSSSVDTPTQAPPDSAASPGVVLKSLPNTGSARVRKKARRKVPSPVKRSGEEQEEVWYQRSCSRCFAEDALDLLRDFHQGRGNN